MRLSWHRAVLCVWTLHPLSDLKATISGKPRCPPWYACQSHSTALPVRLSAPQSALHENKSHHRKWRASGDSADSPLQWNVPSHEVPCRRKTLRPWTDGTPAGLSVLIPPVFEPFRTRKKHIRYDKDWIAQREISWPNGGYPVADTQSGSVWFVILQENVEWTKWMIAFWEKHAIFVAVIKFNY